MLTLKLFTGQDYNRILLSSGQEVTAIRKTQVLRCSKNKLPNIIFQAVATGRFSFDMQWSLRMRHILSVKVSY